MLIKYFASIRERVGREEERIEIPASVTTIAELLDDLAGRDETYAFAFGDRETLRAALDQMHVELDTPLAGASELALFPPMTGG
ncbi:molybdopterin converting factor subunit 1 [Roseibium aestuarii]|uniref:Molybdopterin converting factor subunit 1 n=1 Tax=Roseibium aestuarii TaxID=2600299 RepID=A0ABW4JWN6_9HYPH|nr:molybdopterin converting factor subunit 1 [Roseibium aestuarii]